jgi:ATP-citrate lyase beta-subunit
MAQKPIREFDVKKLFNQNWESYFSEFIFDFKSVLINKETSLSKEIKTKKWLSNESLVVKPDMLFGKRGINDLVLYKEQKPGDVSLLIAEKWINQKSKGITQLKSGESGRLTHFIIEPFIPHASEEEFYIAATSRGLDDVLFLSLSGGVEIEEDWESKVSEIHLPIDATDKQIKSLIKKGIPQTGNKETHNYFEKFAISFYKFFRDFHFAYLEINPIVLKNNKVFLLDAVARMDDTAAFIMEDKWEGLTFPTSFGMDQKCEEVIAIENIDHKSGASLKLTILNPKGRVWTLVAGGGASVVYADTIANMCRIEELANYGEYSGGPTTDETRFYSETIFDLMTRHTHSKEKVLIIGGAIANFTDVAKTFEGIIQAMQKYQDKLKEHKTKIYVRRGGPNYKKGLKNIEQAAKNLGLYIEVYGPETPITDIVKRALS